MIRIKNYLDETNKTPSAKTSKRRAANVKLRIAVRSGEIKKPDHCTKCKKKCTPEGHHTDYSKPLKVKWLCPACHAQYHKKGQKDD